MSKCSSRNAMLWGFGEIEGIVTAAISLKKIPSKWCIVKRVLTYSLANSGDIS